MRVLLRQALSIGATIAVATTVVVSTLLPASTAFAQGRGRGQSDTINPACGRRYAGSYLTTFTGDVGGSPFFSRSVVTLDQDGNVFVVDSNQDGFLRISDIQGAWTCKDDDGFAVRALSFALASSSDPSSIGRVDYDGTFTDNGIAGTVELRLFELSADPLVEGTPAVGTFEFSGERITAH